MEPQSPNPNPQAQKELEWVKLVEVIRRVIEGQRIGIDAVIALFNTYSKQAKLSYSLIDDVVAVEVIDEADNPFGPYIAVVTTTKQGLRVRVDFELKEKGIKTELSITSLHQSDCYCSCGD
jgi:hypothetical protein